MNRYAGPSASIGVGGAYREIVTELPESIVRRTLTAVIL